jgi:hypothetical protein
MINKTDNDDDDDDDDDKRSSRKYTRSRFVPFSRAFLIMSIASQKPCPFISEFNRGNR